MNEEIRKQFVNDIIENLEDDTPRLIYADWLDDHDDSDRATFIRTQIAMSRGRGVLQCAVCRDKENGETAPRYADMGMRCAQRAMSCTCSPSWQNMQLLVDEKLDAHRGEWLKRYCPVLTLQLISSGAKDVFRLVWVRGFPARVRCHWEDWKRLGKTLLRDLPLEVVQPSHCEAYVIRREGLLRTADPSLLGQYRLWGIPEDLRDSKELQMCYPSREFALKVLTQECVAYVDEEFVDDLRQM